MHVFLYIFKLAKLNRLVSVTLHCFFLSLRSFRAVSYIELLFAWVILLWSRHTGYTNSIEKQ